MKPHQTKPRLIKNLATLLSQLDSEGDIQALLQDLCSPSELQALAERLHILPLLEQGIPYRTIAKDTGMSITTIGRVARCMREGANGYKSIMPLLQQIQNTKENT